MGGKQSIETFPQSKHYTVVNYGYCKVWKRRDTSAQTMEQYDIHIENQQALASYRKMWVLRTQEEAIVMAYYFTHNTPKDLCGVFQEGSILTERIPYRLSQFCNIPYQEIIPILRAVLKSYKVLHEQYGLFQVRSTMIGINTSQIVKVWHHTDFSCPTPQNANCRSLDMMIDTIIKSVEMNADVPLQYSSFSEFVQANRNIMELGFDNMLAMLSTYKRINHIHRRKGLSHLTTYLRQDQGYEDHSHNSNLMNNISKINQVNSSSLDKFSFRNNSSDNSSIHSSRKTVKNQNLNIYTHKEVNQLLSRQKSPYSKSQTVGTPPPKLQKLKYTSNTIDNISPSPRLSHRESAIIGQSINLEPIQLSKISFKIVNQGNNSHFKFLPHSESNNSLDKRIQFQNQHPESIYTQKNPIYNRNVHFNLARAPVYQDSRSNSRSPGSSLAFETR